MGGVWKERAHKMLPVNSKGIFKVKIKKILKLVNLSSFKFNAETITYKVKHNRRCLSTILFTADRSSRPQNLKSFGQA